MGVATAIRERVRTDATSHIEAAALAKIRAVCNFVNAESSRLRHQTIAIAIVSALAALFVLVATDLDMRMVFVIGAGAVALAYVRARAEMMIGTRIAAKRIVAISGTNLKHNPASTLAKKQFAAMDLYTEDCDGWKSRDEIAGKMRGAKFSLHHVRATGKGQRAPFFHGIILKIDYDNGFPGHTVILPARDERGAGTASAVPAARRKKDFVMVKNPAFERVFDVYSTDYFEARQLLTPRFMRVVLEARELLDADLRLCFTNRSLYITVPGQALHLETSLFGQPLTPQAAVGKLPYMLWLADALAELRAVT